MRGDILSIVVPRFGAANINFENILEQSLIFFSFAQCFGSYLCRGKILCSRHEWRCGECSCDNPGDTKSCTFCYLCHTGRSASQRDKDYTSCNTSPYLWQVSIIACMQPDATRHFAQQVYFFINSTCLRRWLFRLKKKAKVKMSL